MAPQLRAAPLAASASSIIAMFAQFFCCTGLSPARAAEEHSLPLGHGVERDSELLVHGQKAELHAGGRHAHGDCWAVLQGHDSLGKVLEDVLPAGMLAWVGGCSAGMQKPAGMRVEQNRGSKARTCHRPRSINRSKPQHQQRLGSNNPRPRHAVHPSGNGFALADERRQRDAPPMGNERWSTSVSARSWGRGRWFSRRVLLRGARGMAGLCPPSLRAHESGAVRMGRVGGWCAGRS